MRRERHLAVDDGGQHVDRHVARMQAAATRRPAAPRSSHRRPAGARRSVPLPSPGSRRRSATPGGQPEQPVRRGEQRRRPAGGVPVDDRAEVLAGAKAAAAPPNSPAWCCRGRTAAASRRATAARRRASPAPRRARGCGCRGCAPARRGSGLDRHHVGRARRSTTSPRLVATRSVGPTSSRCPTTSVSGGTEPAGSRYRRLTLVPTAGRSAMRLSGRTDRDPRRASSVRPGHAPAVGLHRSLRRAGVPADQPVDVEEPVEVSGLVLQHPGEQAGALERDRACRRRRVR